MSNPKNPTELKLTVVRSKSAEPPQSSDTPTSSFTSRIADCRGAVHLAIEAILSGDEDEIDASLGSLCLAERELKRLTIEMDAAEAVAGVSHG